MSQIRQAAAVPALPSVLFVLLASFAALGPLSLDIYLPAVSRMSTELSASPSEATASLSVFFIGMAAGQLVVGPWSDRVGRRLPLIVGLVLAAFGTLLCGLAPDIATLLGARLVQALGSAAVMVTGRATIRDHLDERGAARFLSTTATINSLAPMLAPSAGAFILGVAGWRSIFYTTGAVALLMLFGTVRALPESHRPTPGAQRMHPFHVYASLLAHRRFLGFLLAAAGNGAGYFTYMALSPLVLMQGYGVKPGMYGVLMAVNGLGLILCAQINRRLLRTYTPRQILRVSTISSFLLVAPLVLWAFAGTGGVPVLVVLVFVVISSSSFVQSNSIAAALSIEPRHAGSAAALFGAALFGSGTLASFIGGLLFDGTPRSLMLLMAGAQLLMCLALRSLALSADRSLDEAS